MKPSLIAKYVSKAKWGDANPFHIASGIFLSLKEPGLIAVLDKAPQIDSNVVAALDLCGYLEYIWERERTAVKGLSADSGLLSGPALLHEAPKDVEKYAIVRAVGLEIVEVLVASRELREIVSEWIEIPVDEKDVVRALRGSEFLTHFENVLREAA